MGILLVDDSPELAASLARGIAEQGFAVEVESTGRGAAERLLTRTFDAVILDLGLPDLDGLQVLSAARDAGNNVPALVLTARTTVSSRVSALDLGADDYLVKPFEFAELIARLRALVRRSSCPRWAPLCFGDLRLDADDRGAQVGGRRLTFSPREHALLYHLVRQGHDISSRKDLLAHVFDCAFAPRTNVLEVHIANLRRKLAGTSIVIENVRGTGYRLRIAEELIDDVG